MSSIGDRIRGLWFGLKRTISSGFRGLTRGGRRRRKPQRPTLTGNRNDYSIGFHRLTSYDRFLLYSALSASILEGLCNPLAALTFGALAGPFIAVTKNGFLAEDEVNYLACNCDHKDNKSISELIEEAPIYSPTQLESSSSNFSIILIALSLVSIVASWVKDRCWDALTFRIVHKIRGLARRWIRTRKARSSDESVQRLAEDVDNVNDKTSHSFAHFIKDSSTFASGLIIGLSNSWKITTVIMSSSALFLVLDSTGLLKSAEGSGDQVDDEIELPQKGRDREPAIEATPVKTEAKEQEKSEQLEPSNDKEAYSESALSESAGEKEEEKQEEENEPKKSNIKGRSEDTEAKAVEDKQSLSSEARKRDLVPVSVIKNETDIESQAQAQPQQQQQQQRGTSLLNGNDNDNDDPLLARSKLLEKAKYASAIGGSRVVEHATFALAFYISTLSISEGSLSGESAISSIMSLFMASRSLRNVLPSIRDVSSVASSVSHVSSILNDGYDDSKPRTDTIEGRETTKSSAKTENDTENENENETNTNTNQTSQVLTEGSQIIASQDMIDPKAMSPIIGEPKSFDSEMPKTLNGIKSNTSNIDTNSKSDNENKPNSNDEQHLTLEQEKPKTGQTQTKAVIAHSKDLAPILGQIESLPSKNQIQGLKDGEKRTSHELISSNRNGKLNRSYENSIVENSKYHISRMTNRSIFIERKITTTVERVSRKSVETSQLSHAISRNYTTTIIESKPEAMRIEIDSSFNNDTGKVMAENEKLTSNIQSICYKFSPSQWLKFILVLLGSILFGALTPLAALLYAGTIETYTKRPGEKEELGSFGIYWTIAFLVYGMITGLLLSGWLFFSSYVIETTLVRINKLEPLTGESSPSSRRMSNIPRVKSVLKTLVSSIFMASAIFTTIVLGLSLSWQLTIVLVPLMLALVCLIYLMSKSSYFNSNKAKLQSEQHKARLGEKTKLLDMGPTKGKTKNRPTIQPRWKSSLAQVGIQIFFACGFRWGAHLLAKGDLEFSNLYRVVYSIPITTLGLADTTYYITGIRNLDRPFSPIT